MSEESSTQEQTETLSESLSAAFDANVAEPEIKEAALENQSTETIVETKEASPEDSNQPSEDALVETEKVEAKVETKEVSPPEHWSDEDKEAFMAMDESGRDWALRLEANAAKGIEKKSAELKIFRDAFQPYKHLFPEGTETQVIQRFFNSHVFLQNNPVEGIKWLKKNYGIDEEQSAPSTETTDEFADPEVTKLRAEIKELKTTSERNAQNAQQTQQNAMIAEINQFRDVEEDGERLHTHFNEVSGVMSGLMQSGRADSLEKAYEQAVWSLPEYRDSVVQQKADEKAKADLEEKTRKVTAAEKAAASVNGKSSTQATKKSATITDSLNEAYDKSVRGEL